MKHLLILLTLGAVFSFSSAQIASLFSDVLAIEEVAGLEGFENCDPSNIDYSSYGGEVVNGIFDIQVDSEPSQLTNAIQKIEAGNEAALTAMMTSFFELNPQFVKNWRFGIVEFDVGFQILMTSRPENAPPQSENVMRLCAERENKSD